MNKVFTLILTTIICGTKPGAAMDWVNPEKYNQIYQDLPSVGIMVEHPLDEENLKEINNKVFKSVPGIVSGRFKAINGKVYEINKEEFRKAARYFVGNALLSFHNSYESRLSFMRKNGATHKIEQENNGKIWNIYEGINVIIPSPIYHVHPDDIELSFERTAICFLEVDLQEYLKVYHVRQQVADKDWHGRHFDSVFTSQIEAPLQIQDSPKIEDLSKTEDLAGWEILNLTNIPAQASVPDDWLKGEILDLSVLQDQPTVPQELLEGAMIYDESTIPQDKAPKSLYQRVVSILW